MNEYKGIMPIKIELTLEQSQQGVSNDVLDSYKDRDGDASFQLKSDSLPHAHAQTTKTYYKHQDSRIKKAQVLKTKTSANSDKQDLPLRYQVYQGRLLKSFQEDAKWLLGSDKGGAGVVFASVAGCGGRKPVGAAPNFERRGEDQYPSKGDDWFELSIDDVGKVKVLRVFKMIEHDGRACIYGAFVSVNTNDILTNDEFPILDVGRKIISKDNGRI
ncbi:hypothetical protein Tco_0490426 [Tanacetum coccineum]